MKLDVGLLKVESWAYSRETLLILTGRGCSILVTVCDWRHEVILCTIGCANYYLAQF
jgi:hypothetical protein